MKYAIDRIEEEYAICENIETKEKIELKWNTLPFKVKEGNILTEENGIFTLDSETEKERIERIRKKMDYLKNLSQ